MNEHHNSLRYILDALSVSATFAAVLGWLPPISAALSILWLSIQIGEWIARKVRR